MSSPGATTSRSYQLNLQRSTGRICACFPPFVPEPPTTA